MYCLTNSTMRGSEITIVYVCRWLKGWRNQFSPNMKMFYNSDLHFDFTIVFLFKFYVRMALNIIRKECRVTPRSKSEMVGSFPPVEQVTINPT